ncbi:MAG: hypothetical protein JSC189_001070 [Candidatus Tokpelaia sp. JSC189]|nr:MAG: hypothetical protein JSC189_001070 [Candidatus Tokpelaia sp. JSC189]
MREIMDMIKKAKEMQEEIANLEVTGSSGAGLVNITLNGQGNIKAIKIDSSLMKPEESEILEDLIIAAHNEAKAKIETAVAQKTQGLTAGLPIPPGLNLWF